VKWGLFLKAWENFPLVEPLETTNAICAAPAAAFTGKGSHYERMEQFVKRTGSASGYFTRPFSYDKSCTSSKLGWNACWLVIVVGSSLPSNLTCGIAGSSFGFASARA
jgi:hypothetical protein